MARGQAALDEVVGQINQQHGPGTAQAISCDLCDLPAVRDMVKKAVGAPQPHDWLQFMIHLLLCARLLDASHTRTLNPATPTTQSPPTPQVSLLGGLDTLVNNGAPGLDAGTFADFANEDSILEDHVWSRMYDVHVRASVALVKVSGGRQVVLNSARMHATN